MSHTLIVKWVVKESETSRVQSLLAELTERSRAETGNLLYTVYQSESDPNVFILHESYASADDVEFHRRSDHYQNIVVREINPHLTSREVTVVKRLL